MSDELIEELDESTADYLRAIHERDGELTAESVRADAIANPASPIRARLEWDPEVGLREYQLEQCRRILRGYFVIVEERPVRAFVYVKSTGSYKPVAEAMARPDWRKEVLDRFERDAEAFRARWENHKVAGEHYRRWAAKEARRVKQQATPAAKRRSAAA